ncbi:MAG: hypothetical protein DRJ03_00030 [Chloroflexi bacterium]|nr:MAG: hypothetical protein DRJ03_00030 [Chloroflexota bacterium]
MMTHAEAAAKFKRCRNKEVGYRLGKATLLQKRGRAFAIKFHDTDVVMIRPDGTYRLHSGSWNTVTTKDRINRFSPCCLSQTHGMWHIYSVPFTDGMLIDSGGKPIDPPTYTIDDVWKLKRRVDRLFNKFVKIVAKAARYQDIGKWQPHGGRKVPQPTTKPHLTKLWNAILVETSKKGEWANGPGHLFQWIHLAVRNVGWGNKQQVIDLIQSDAMNGNDSHFLLDSLRVLGRRRKPHIVNMILAGELSDGTVRVS